MDKNSTLVNEELLAKYLLDEATTPERELVDQWIKASPDNTQQLNDLKSILLVSTLPIDDSLNEQEALDRLNERLAQHTKTKSLSYKNLIRFVAAVVIVLSGWFGYQYMSTSNISLNTTSRILIQQLPDGSTATLNKRSSLTFTVGFFSKTRHVNLQGDAFFNVTPDQDQPFVIDAHDVRITVVGTAFNVKSSVQKTVINVESGIVKVRYHNDSVSLEKGEKAEIANNRLIKSVSKGKLYNYYFTNELVCDRTPLSELIPVLNEKFNTNIEIANPAISSLPINTTFKDEPLKKILDIIALTLKIKVEYGQGNIKLK